MALAGNRRGMSWSQICKMLQVGGTTAIVLAIYLWGGDQGKSKYLGISFGGIASLAIGTLARMAFWQLRRTHEAQRANDEQPHNPN